MLPFFRFGANERPLAVVSGGLIFDSGEAENTFIFRCQDRYVTYNSVCDLQTLLFVTDTQHRERYERLLQNLRADLETIASVTGLALGGIPNPEYVLLDPDRLSIVSKPCTPQAVVLNQISPTYARLLSEMGVTSRSSEYNEVGELAMRFHNKSEYVRLLQASHADNLPPHVPTSLVPPKTLIGVRTWGDLLALYTPLSRKARPANLYVKSSLDSGGNVAALLCADNFDTRFAGLRRDIERHVIGRGFDDDEAIRNLRAEIDLAPSLEGLHFTDDQIRRYRQSQFTRRTGIDMLIQRALTAPTQPAHLPESVGFTYHISGPNSYSLIAAAAQIYGDPDQGHFIGSLVSDELTAKVAPPTLQSAMHNLCGLFSDAGYRGPINFDARLNSESDYLFIFDCNPRLSAVYPPLAVREKLRSLQYRVDSVISLGYRGEYVHTNIAHHLTEMDQAGILFTPKSKKGILLLPNISRRNGFDALLINITRHEAQHIVDSGVLLRNAESRSAGVHQLF